MQGSKFLCTVISNRISASFSAVPPKAGLKKSAASFFKEEKATLLQLFIRQLTDVEAENMNLMISLF